MFKKTYQTSLKTIIRSPLVWGAIVFVLAVGIFHQLQVHYTYFDPSSLKSYADTDPEFNMSFKMYINEVLNTPLGMALMLFSVPAFCVIVSGVVLVRDWRDGFFEVDLKDAHPGHLVIDDAGRNVLQSEVDLYFLTESEHNYVFSYDGTDRKVMDLEGDTLFQYEATSFGVEYGNVFIFYKYDKDYNLTESGLLDIKGDIITAGKTHFFMTLPGIFEAHEPWVITDDVESGYWSAITSDGEIVADQEPWDGGGWNLVYTKDNRGYVLEDKGYTLDLSGKEVKNAGPGLAILENTDQKTESLYDLVSGRELLADVYDKISVELGKDDKGYVFALKDRQWSVFEIYFERD